MYQQDTGRTGPQQSIQRVRLFFMLVAAIIGIFWVRSFYLQVIRHDYYAQAARNDQLREYQIPAARGIIEAHDGDSIVPIVLNQKLYTMYADPVLVKKPDQVASTLAAVLGGDASKYRPELSTPNTRYVVLATKVAADQKDAILKRKYPGIGAQEFSYRIYPDGSLASQLLGFVNAQGTGVYGIEQAMNKQLAGTNGQLKAVTDVNGVPLAANTNNIETAPVSGDNLVLTINIAMQKQLQDILQKGLEKYHSKAGSALVIDPNTGAVKAMVNWPTYDPSNYGNVSDPKLFENPAVDSPLEVGSVMKILTTAAALNEGVIQENTTYHDPAVWTIDGYKITNIKEDGGPAERSIAELLNLSLNTGATWMLMQMSKPGGTEINQHGRDLWYNYMTKHFRLGQPTGIEQGYEASGYIPDPDHGYALNLTYANTSFGQGMTATILQMAAAYSSVLNGGTYYQPHLVDQIISPDGKTTTVQPKVLERNVVAPKVSQELQPLMQYVVDHHYILPPFNQQVFNVGGKTGTAQIADRNGPGGYLPNDFNGTYLGYVGGDKPQYIIGVVIRDPKIAGYAGGDAAEPIFAEIAHTLINQFGVTPRSR